MHANIGVWQEWRFHNGYQKPYIQRGNTVVRLTKTIAYISLHRNLTNEQHNPPRLQEHSLLAQTCSTSSTCHFIHVTNPVIFTNKSWIRNEVVETKNRT